MTNNSQNSQKSQWDFGRFIKTLSFFGAVPFLSNWDWFQQWFGSRPDPKVDSSRLAYHTASDSSSIPTQDTNSMLSHRPIFDFTQPSSDLQEVWGALDDVVMGGVSQSGIQIGAATANFSGTVSTANSGGFASVRTRNFEPPLDLSEFDGIELRLKGDGNRYKFMLRTETRWDGIAHCYSFDTVADNWITVQIPFTAFTPVFRAKTVSNSPIDPSRIYAMQLMLSKFEYDGELNPHFQAGFFQLQVESIQAYRA
jgi:outer membrane lipoprotein SlyB